MEDTYSQYCIAKVTMLQWNGISALVDSISSESKTDRKCWLERMGAGQQVRNKTETLQFWMHGPKPTP